MQISLLKLISEFEQLAADHLQLNDFKYGDILDSLKGEKIDYACLFMNVANANTTKNESIMIVNLLFMDRTTKNDSNKIYVENTMLHVLQDFCKVINYSDRWQEYGDTDLGDPTRKYYDNFADVTTGWGIDLTINIYNENGICDLPIINYNYNEE